MFSDSVLFLLKIAGALQGDINETDSDHNWKMGELEFECLMRILDDAGYCTGYVYRQTTGGMTPKKHLNPAACP